MKKQKFFIITTILTILILIVSFFLINKNRTQKIGKNSSNQEIVDYILNISSYEVEINVEINSNKNSNKYVLKQRYIKDKVSTQEVIEPNNIKGIRIVKEENKLTLENSNLNLSTVFENYNYIGDNALDLDSFIIDYKENNESYYEEKDNEILMKTITKNENRYIKNKILYIDKATANPIKMEIRDINQNTTINILYNEVKINNQDIGNTLAFNLYNISKEV